MGKIDLFANKDGDWIPVGSADEVKIIEEDNEIEPIILNKEYKFECEVRGDIAMLREEVSEIIKWLREVEAKSIRIEKGKYVVTWKDGTEQVYEIEEREERFFVGGDNDLLAKWIADRRDEKRIEWDKEYGVEWWE